MKVAPSVKLAAILRGATGEEQDYTRRYFSYLENLAGLSEIRMAKAGEEQPLSSGKPLRKAEVLIQMKDLINKDDELKRLAAMQQKLEANIKSGESRLKNEAFVSKAPAKIIEGAKAQLEVNRAQLQKVLSQIEALKAL